MNNTKRNLIVAAIVIELLSVVVNLIFFIYGFCIPEIKISAVDIIFDVILIGGQTAVAVLLLVSIWGWGKHFNSRRGLYTAALIISVCVDTFSLVTLLLVISLFTSDIVWVKPIDDVYFGHDDEDKETVDEKTEVVRDESVEKKIAKLRERLDKGEITEEEFKEELFKLL